MEMTNELQDFIKALENNTKNSVPITTSFNHDQALGLIQYATENGSKKPQDIIRIAVNVFLKKAGYPKGK